MSELRRAVIVSVTVHLLLISLFLMPLAFPGCGRPQGGNGPDQPTDQPTPSPSDSIDVEIVPLPGPHQEPQPEVTSTPEVTPTPEETEAPDPEPSESPSPTPTPSPSSEPDPDCEQFFGGIGITYSPGGVIIEVYEGYPAYENGVERGDKLLNPSEIRGEVGTEVYVVVEHGHKTRVIKMKRGKICVQKTKNKGNLKDR